MNGTRTLALACALALTLVGTAPAASQPKPEGEMRWALYVTLAPLWFDPGEVAGQITPFWVLYAIHDALVKPMPGNLMTPSLAETWSMSADGRVYEFKLREGVQFHNGDPFTAEDVKFSFLRAKGAKLLRENVREVAIVDPYRVRFHLREPWPDFMTFYGTLATAAGWIVPKNYIERVGDDGFKRHPIGLGPYKFVSQSPGIELVMEAFEGYWRKVPQVKRLVYKSVPEATTRMAMLKKGEVGVAHRARPLRSREVEAVAGGGRLPQRLRCRGPARVSPVCLDDRSGRRLPGGRGDQDEGPNDGARGLLLGVGHEEAQRGVHVRQRPLR